MAGRLRLLGSAAAGHLRGHRPPASPHMAFKGQLSASTAAAALGAPSERRRLHAAPAGSAALLLVDCLIVALSSSVAQGSCTRSPGPSACFVQAADAAATFEKGGRQPQGPRIAWGSRVPLAASGGAACCWLSRRPPQLRRSVPNLTAQFAAHSSPRHPPGGCRC